MARALPGLAREMAQLRGDDQPDLRCLPLRASTATVHNSISMLAGLYCDFTPSPCSYATTPQPLQAALGRLLEEKDGNGNRASARPTGRFSMELAAAPDQEGNAQYDLSLDGEPVTPPENVKQLFDSILQDLGEIPDDYLPHMYGPVNWALVGDVARLPLKVADTYRRLTT